MRWSKRSLAGIGVATVLAGAAAVWAQARAGASGLCLFEEDTYFSCKTQHSKWIAVCGTRDGLVQYRFGKSKNVELRYPRERDERPLRYAHYARADTDRVEVSFVAFGARYTVFDYTEGGRQNAGVRVTKAKGREVVMSCAGRPRSRLFELETRLGCDEESALNLGGCAPESSQ